MRDSQVFVVEVCSVGGDAELLRFLVRAVEDVEAVTCHSPADVIRLLLSDRDDAVPPPATVNPRTHSPGERS